MHPAAARLLASEGLLRRAVFACQCWLCVHALELVWKVVFEDGPQEVGAGVPLALEDQGWHARPSVRDLVTDVTVRPGPRQGQQGDGHRAAAAMF